MPLQSASLRRVKAFAADAGVSVRTLHLYDRLGLLRPAAVEASGYRLYGEAELERLEHILALRFVGFTLDQIKQLLGNRAAPLDTALRMQREVIAQRKRRLEAALAAIDAARRALVDGAPDDRWEILRNVIEVFEMENDWKWTQEYYSQEARAKIEERAQSLPRDTIEQRERDWGALIAEVETAVAQGVDPSSERAQALAARWRDLVGQFTQGDPEISRGLSRLWSDRTHWPSDFKRPWSDAADAFIKTAGTCGENGAVDGD